jgi:hypothetical protein
VFGFKIQLFVHVFLHRVFPLTKVLFGLVIDIIHMNESIFQHIQRSFLCFWNMIMCLVLKFKVSCLHYTLVVSNSCFITCITCIELNTQILTTNGQLSLSLSHTFIIFLFSLLLLLYCFCCKRKKRKRKLSQKSYQVWLFK